MAYREFDNIATTAYRPNYLNNEAKRYGRYGVNGNVRVEFKVSGPLHQQPGKHLERAVDRALETTARIAKGFVREDTPVDTGLLRRRWYYKKVKWDEYRLSNDIFYSPFQEKRVQMLGKNLRRIQDELNKQLDKEIPRALN